MKASDIIKIALVDDHTLVNEALAKVINGFDRFRVVLLAGSGEEMIQQILAGNVPDLAILDISMPGMGGYETARWLQQKHPDIIVMALTMYDSELSTVLLIKAGVRGVLQKNIKSADLRRGIEATLQNGYFFSNNRLVALLLKPVPNGGVFANNVMLSENELIFLKLNCSELTYKEIAREMAISVRTVEKYRDSLFLKLNINSNKGLVLFAVKNGLGDAS